MLGQFDSLKAIVRVRYYSIDNFVFKLHYRLTFYIFLVATILVTSRQYIGEHIKCLSDSGVPTHVMDTFCFFTTTFTIPQHYNSTLLKRGSLAHPGVGPMGTRVNEEEVRRHAYYQWVPFVLFAQAIMFYLPHIIWKGIEGGTLKRLADGLHNGIISETDSVDYGDCHIMSKKERESRLEVIRGFIRNKEILNKSWSYYLIFCEHINFFNVIFQAFLIDRFLGGQFFSLGNHIIEHGVTADVTILDHVFPKVTKCTFHKFGPSGSMQSHDAMCVMALNIINEKIYTFLWFWLIFLLLCSGLALLYRYASLLLHSRSKCFNEVVFSAWRPAKLSPWMYFTVTKHFDYTEWLFLNYLSQNMDGLAFRELFTLLAGDTDVKKNDDLYEKEKTLPLQTEKATLLEKNEKDAFKD
ncbi:Innexin [Oryctes borbonicus]|uniref:Innexin n=1 Tax=Oryctes borbonicus TaxID=1629725 RepID=A0A0T6BB60_9SCAR|nr:Innexin [Oryctes borbonicus]